MMSLRIAIVLFATCLFFDQVKSDELPTPRPPVGGRLSEMIPEELVVRNAVPANGVRIRNVGKYLLSLQWWDEGVSTWRTISIGPGHSFDLICIKCVDSIDVAYNDGRTTKEMKAVIGDVYILRWSLELQAWELTVPSIDEQ